MNNENGSFSKDPASIKSSVQNLVDQGTETVDAIKSKVADVKTRVGDVTGTVKDGGAQAYSNLVSFVQANPFKGIALAFGIGYVAMRIRTSPILKLALLGGLGMAGRKMIQD
jgi:ElaB/YqjD/DUF883 family membrane-anchored ribosome-binding protein